MIPEFAARKDELKDQLTGELKTYLYDQLSPDYCAARGLDFLAGVPVPFTPSNYVKFQEGGELSVSDIADNIIVSLGADTRFKYSGPYKRFLAKFFDEKLVDVALTRAHTELGERRFRRACIYARAALLLDDKARDALYTYACVCREWYLSLEGEDGSEELVALLKSESGKYFEYTSEADPDFAPTWYYMGYNYLNQALYRKAQLAWQRFIELKGSDGDEAVTEIKERLEALEQPVVIESGINELTAGRFEEGLRILEPFVGTDYGNWWPLHFYLAIAYRQLGFYDEAIEGFRRVIALAPSNYESNLALAQLYSQKGEDELAEKYARKADLLSRENPRS
ncbi:MAG: tetratricopeptide repeat protein [Firmicutes bacterium]|nr:tetratricopeptide repeat protein [Bacillota bacterium]